MTREEALKRVRELLHGEAALASMSLELRYQIDNAITDYGHAAAIEAIESLQQAIIERKRT